MPNHRIRSPKGIRMLAWGWPTAYPRRIGVRALIHERKLVRQQQYLRVLLPCGQRRCVVFRGAAEVVLRVPLDTGFAEARVARSDLPRSERQDRSPEEPVLHVVAAAVDDEI